MVLKINCLKDKCTLKIPTNVMNEDEISQTLGRWAKGTFAYMVLVIFNLFGNDA